MSRLEFQLRDNKPRETVILSESKGAIEAVTDSAVGNKYHEAMLRVGDTLQILLRCRIQTFITSIPAHIGIYYNEMVNKVATELKKNGPTDGMKWISLSACRSVVATQLKRVWQCQWDISPTGRTTHDYIPNVGIKTVFPKTRCIANLP